MMPSFEEQVIKTVAQIKRGDILSYRQVAQKAGRPRAYRSVGNILNRNYRHNVPKIPCHRVIKSNGEVGNFILGRRKKEELLIREGIKIENHRVIS